MYERESEESQRRGRQPRLDLYDLHPNMLSTFPSVTGSVVSPIRLVSWQSLAMAAVLVAFVYVALRGV